MAFRPLASVIGIVLMVSVSAISRADGTLFESDTNQSFKMTGTHLESSNGLFKLDRDAKGSWAGSWWDVLLYGAHATQTNKGVLDFIYRTPFHVDYSVVNISKDVMIISAVVIPGGEVNPKFNVRLSLDLAKNSLEIMNADSANNVLSNETITQSDRGVYVTHKLEGVSQFPEGTIIKTTGDLDLKSLAKDFPLLLVMYGLEWEIF